MSIVNHHDPDCRTSRNVLKTLPAGPLYKEDGELLIDEQGERVG